MTKHDEEERVIFSLKLRDVTYGWPLIQPTKSRVNLWKMLHLFRKAIQVRRCRDGCLQWT